MKPMVTENRPVFTMCRLFGAVQTANLGITSLKCPYGARARRWVESMAAKQQATVEGAGK